MPIVYRTWAKIKLRQLQSWVDTWSGEHIFAGVRSVGAADAWMSASVRMERARLANWPVALTTVDLFKCFDQVNRPIAYSILAAAGAPVGFLRGYMGYMEGMRVMGSYLNGVGSLQERPCAIPQGCPWSMTVVALLGTVWARFMSDHHPAALVRVLADDLLVGSGTNSQLGVDEMCEEHEEAVRSTVRFMTDVGARVSIPKCKTIATQDQARRRLRRAIVPGFGGSIPVGTDFRDLGAHASAAVRSVGTTLTKRLTAATRVARKIAAVPMTHAMRVRMLLSKVLPLALYACAAVPAAARQVEGLRTAMVWALDRGQAGTRSTAHALATTWPK
eukprot:4011759-Alexandrium_andersonii.AAC.1